MAQITEITVVYERDRYKRPIKLSVPSSKLQHAFANRPRAQDSIIMLFKDEYHRRYRKRFPHGSISWSALKIDVRNGWSSTESAQQKAQDTHTYSTWKGCDCECAACDNGRHCCNEGRGCNL